MTTDVFHRLDEVLAGVPRTGVVQVGAHKGQEVPDFRAAGFERIVLVEANPALWPCLERMAGTVLERCAAGPPGRGVLHVTKWDERSSLLAPVEYPVVRRTPVDVRPLAELQAGCNVAVLDVQGGELDVLRTADLGSLDAVIVECDDRTRYVGAATTADVDEFMLDAGWFRHSEWGGHSAPSLVDVVWLKECP